MFSPLLWYLCPILCHFGSKQKAFTPSLLFFWFYQVQYPACFMQFASFKTHLPHCRCVYILLGNFSMTYHNMQAYSLTEQHHYPHVTRAWLPEVSQRNSPVRGSRVIKHVNSSLANWVLKQLSNHKNTCMWRTQILFKVGKLRAYITDWT